MAITTPIKVEFNDDFDLELTEMVVGGTPAKAIKNNIKLGTGLFGRTILEMTYNDNIMAFVDTTVDISGDEGLSVDFVTKKKRTT